MKRELVELAERAEKASGPDRELDWRIGDAIGHPSFARKIEGMFPPFMPWSRCDEDVPRYTASIDAAMQLVPEGWDFAVSREGGAGVAGLSNGARFARGITASTPALALVAASLRARAEG